MITHREYRMRPEAMHALQRVYRKRRALCRADAKEEVQNG